MHCRSIPVFLLFLFVASVTLAQTVRTAPRFTPPGLDGRFVELARQVPGFGGYFFDEQGDLNVYLTDLSQEAAARTAVAAVARNRPEHPDHPWGRPAEILVRRGDYDFPQLDVWRDQLRAALAISGVESLDTDEAANCVRVGVTSQEAAASVQALGDSLGVPRGALVVEMVSPITRLARLTDYVRPTEGGLEVFGYGNGCTLGVNVWYTNFNMNIPRTAGFLTASHCSRTMAATDGTVFSQGGQTIGVELWDPPFFYDNPPNDPRPQCPGGFFCRYSDVSFVKYYDKQTRYQGAIARTLFYGLGHGQQGSLEIDPNNPHFLINGEVHYPAMGTYLDKIGKRTGWTKGKVSKTCFDKRETNYVLLCQYQVAAHAAGGDSGAPVFRITSSGAAFAGILWGGQIGASGSYEFIFSNTPLIHKDFGQAISFSVLDQE